MEGAYKAISNDIMLFQHWSSHLRVLVVVVCDEVLVAHAGLLFHQDGGFDDFAEAGCIRVASFEDHGDLYRFWCLMIAGN